MSMTEPTYKKKRFIAGAVCPDCAVADRVFTYEDESGARWRACVDCDFRSSLASDIAAPAQELQTRVNRNRPGEQPLVHETPFEAVKILPANSDKKDLQ